MSLVRPTSLCEEAPAADPLARSRGPRRIGRPRGSTYVLGLTGSIGMGKTTIAQWLGELEVPCLDSDKVVHEMYAPGGAAVETIRSMFGEGVVTEEGGIDRNALSKLVIGPGNAQNLKRLEGAVFPLVDVAREAFVKEATARGEPLVVLDIPLLFERGAEELCDSVMVASASPESQRRRVMSREGMTREKYEGILAKQVPDYNKRAMADVVLDTDRPMETTRRDLEQLVTLCRERVVAERR